MPKAKALFSARQRLVPQFGVIEGGLLDGWSFAYVRLVILKDRVHLDLRCQPKAWPFPKTVRLSTADYLGLRNPGEVASCYEMQNLVDAAVAAGKNKAAV
jgi:hypothetical protein